MPGDSTDNNDNRPAIDVSVMCPDWQNALPDAAAACARAAEAVFTVVTPDLPDGAEVSLALADDAMIRDLNRDYRGQDKATNVLSFALNDTAPAEADVGADGMLGDVVLAFETISREADDQAKSLPDHLAHMVVHGVLRLLGFDHETDAEAREMEALEVSILSGLGIADPYDSTPTQMKQGAR